MKKLLTEGFLFFLEFAETVEKGNTGLWDVFSGKISLYNVKAAPG